MEKRIFKIKINKEVSVYSWWEVLLSTKQINKQTNQVNPCSEF